MPFGFTRAGFHYNYSTGIVGEPYTLLDTIATYMRDYMTDFRNPSFYVYEQDGIDSTAFNDGGLDMFDNPGHAILPWLKAGTQYPNAYQGNASTFFPIRTDWTKTGTAVTDDDFYYISLGYQKKQSGIAQSSAFHPLLILGARSSTGNSIGFQTAGNSGADGSGLYSSQYVYNNATVNGFETYAWFRSLSSAGDPSTCTLFMLLGHQNWSTQAGTLVTFSATNSSTNHAYMFMRGSNVANYLSICTLLSKASGVAVTAGEVTTVANNITLRIKEALGY